jgi:hypothetical protein
MLVLPKTGTARLQSNGTSMTLWMHFAKWIFGALAVLALTISATLYSCAYFFCDNEIVAELPSQDGKYKL